MKTPESHWLISKKTDLLFIFLPIWAVLIYCFSLPDEVINYKLSISLWVVFILGIDVSHVWSTIFRTYLDKEERQQHKKVLTFAPIISFAFVLAVCAVNEFLFWSVLAYYALYHFVKQQYGFFALYKRKAKFEDGNCWVKSKTMLLVGVLYPVLYWHLSGDRVFYWFDGGDFIRLHHTYLLGILKLCSFLYVGLHLFWLGELVIRNIKIPIGLVLWVITSSLVWYLGIVWFNSDVVFSLTNVVAHGVPYMVLVFYYIEKKKSIKQNKPLEVSRRLVLQLGMMLLLVLLFALTEEYFWDWLVYREKSAFFNSWIGYPFDVYFTGTIRVVFISLLSIPQLTHYILDGYIWKGKTMKYKIF